MISYYVVNKRLNAQKSYYESHEICTTFIFCCAMVGDSSLLVYLHLKPSKSKLWPLERLKGVFYVPLQGYFTGSCTHFNNSI